MTFGQHQTFYLRQQWLTKGLTEVKEKPRFFYDEDHFEVLGVGKNMAKSIRYWLNVTQLVQEKRSAKVEQVMSDFGQIVFQYDKYIKTPFTLSVLHYFLTTEKNEASSWYWFFNVFNERVFTKTLLLQQLEFWVKQTFDKEVSSNSLKRDIDCLLQLYLIKDYKNQTPEDVIKSPFETLGLVLKTSGTNYMKQSLKHVLTPAVLYITLLKYMDKYSINEVSLNDIVNAPELWGRVFNLGRDTIVDYLGEMQQIYPLLFTRTNRLDVIRITSEVNWIDAIRVIYEKEVFTS